MIAILGLVFAVIGYLIWKREKISLLHEYHYDKVSPEDKTAFCRLSGQGILIIGIDILTTAAILGIVNSVQAFIALGIGLVIGISLLLYAGKRYNSGNRG